MGDEDGLAGQQPLDVARCDLDLALDAHHDPRAVDGAGQVLARAWCDDAQPESIDGCREVHDSGREAHRAQEPCQARGEVGDREDLVDVDVLGGEPGTQHVVRGGHDLDRHPAEIRVQRPRRRVQRLPGLQALVVEQERGEESGVARELLRQPVHDRQLGSRADGVTGAPGGLPHPGRHGVALTEQPREGAALRIGPPATQEPDQGVQRRHRELGHELRGLLRLPQAAE